MTKINKTHFRKIFHTALIILLIAPQLVFGLPEGENVVAGSAEFDRSTADTLNINTPSDKLIVNYDNFSIAQQEAVNFHQPSSSAIALNRVVGSDPSNIFGRLSANGRIFIVNPNGVLFASGSRVDAAGLLASTLDISNENFLSGSYNFFKNGGSSFVVNQGEITIINGGYAILLSQGIDNQGSIQADLGKVVLASGEKMTLALDDLNDISVVIDEGVKDEVFGTGGNKIDSAIKNSGTITADGGKVTLTAKALNKVFDHAINNSGIIQANTLINHNGVIELSAEGAGIINIGKVLADGSIEAPDAGKVFVKAPEILHKGVITANAAERGIAGEINIVSKDKTTLDTGSLIEAKAQGLTGKGGKILINSTLGDTFIYRDALIDVSGGSIAGNGGFVEVSAFKTLDFSGTINGKAGLGYLNGAAILDPLDAVIGGGANLNIDTTVWATNNITLTGDVKIDGSYTLNLFSDHNSEISGDWEDGIGEILNPDNRRIEAISGDVTLNLKAGSGIGSEINPITTRGVHTITAEINPDFGSGDINLVSDQADVYLRLAGLFTPSGNINVENQNNAPIIIDRMEFNPLFPFAVETLGGNVTITNVGSIDIPGANSDGISATGDISLTTSQGTSDITAGSDFPLTLAQSIFGSVVLDAGNNIDLGNVFSSDIITDTGTIALSAGNDITLANGSSASSTTGNITVTADNNVNLGLLETAGDVSVTATNGMITVINGGATSIIANDLSLTSALGINLDTAVDTLTASSSNTDIVIREENGLSVNTINSGTGDVSLTLTNGALTDNNAAANNITANDLNLTTVSGIDLDTSVDTFSASSTDSDIIIREANGLSVNTVNAGTGNTSLSTTLGAITDNNGASNNITSNSLTLIGAGGIDLDTAISALTASSTNSDITIREANGLSVNTVNAGTGNASLSTTLGAITDNNGASNNITSNSLTLTAAGGINLDTAVSTLTASTTNTDITIREADNVALNTVNSGTANVDLTSTQGAITDNNGASNNVTANNLTLTVDTGIDLDTTINSLDAIVNGTGNLNINEANAITLASLDTIDGNIVVTAGDTITANNLMSLDTDANGIGGDISLTADAGDINVDTLEADNTIDLTASLGAIVDNNGASNNITSNNLILTADTGIGLDTTVNSLDAILTGTGNLNIYEADAITLTTLDLIDGDINVTAGGTITANDAMALDTDSNGIGGNITLNANAGDISLGTLTADYTIDLTSTLGAISDNNAGSNNVTSNELIIVANSGIGLDSAVNFLNAQTASGNINISNDTSLLTIDDFYLGTGFGVITDDGNVTIANTGSIDSPGTNGDGIYATGDITLTSSNANITSGSEEGATLAWSDAGNITLNAKNDIYLGEVNAGDLFIGSGAGAINLSATNGDITIDNGTYINSQSGNIILTSGNDINLLETLQAGTLIISDASGNITLNANNNISLGVLETLGDIDLTSNSGSISDNNGIANNITANNLILTSGAGIDLDTTINSLDAILTGNGDLLINESDAITLTSLDLVGGSINITAGSTITAIDLLTLDSNGSISLNAATGDITIGSIEAGDTITLTAANGAINEIALGDAEVDLTSSVINLNANDEIGSIDGELDIEIDAGTLSASSTNLLAKDIVITEANDVAIDTITTVGDVYLTSASGSITDSNLAINNITANNLILTALGDVDLDTTINSIDAIVTGTGNLNIDEADAITLASLDVTGGSINVNAGNTITAVNLLALDPSGNITLTANAGDIAVGTLEAGNTVDLTASLGAIVDTNGASNNIASNNLILTASGDVGLDTTINSLDAILTGTGNLNIYEADAITLTTLDLIDGDINVTAGGTITANDAMALDTDSDGIGGNITLNSNAGDISLGTLTADYTIDLTSSLGSITDNNGGNNNITADNLILTADTGIDLDTTINSLDAIVNGTGNLNINETDAITLTALDVIDGNINVTAGGAISVGDVLSLDTGADGIGGDVSLDAQGAITDNNGIANNITANNLILTSGAGIDLDTTINSLDAILTGNGDLLINEFDAITLTSLDLVGGNIDITAGNTITATDLLNLDSNGNITLNATTGDINIGSIEAGDTITLTAANGAINEIALGDAEVDLTSSVINLNAKDEIGSIDGELDIDTDADTLSAQSTNSKDIVISEANDVAIDTITTGGDVYLSSLSGAITDANGVNINNVTANNLILTAGGSVELDTTVNILDALVNNGGLTIRETDDISLYAIDILGGNVNISSGNTLTITSSLFTNGGNLFLSAANGILQEQLGDIDTTGGEGVGAGSYTASADSNNDYIGTYRLASGGSIYTQDIDGSGAIQITAADVDFGSASLLNAGEADVTLIPSFDGITPLTIGLGNANGDFRLTNDELDSISTSGRVIIGNENSGNIALDGVISAGFSDLTLITGGNINDIDADNAVTISNLTLNAGTGIGSITPLNIDVDSLSASTGTGSIFIEEANDVSLVLLTAPDTIQLNANGLITDDNADLTNIIAPDILIAAGDGIGTSEDAIETEIETLDAYVSTGGIFIDEADDLALNQVNANNSDVILTAGGSILDNDLGIAPDDFDIIGSNVTLNVGQNGHIGSAGLEEEVDLDLDFLVSLTENSRPDAPTGLNSPSHASGIWSNNNLADVSWTEAVNPNFYTGSDNSIAGYSYIWDTAADTIPDEIQDIGNINSLNDILLPDSNSNFLHIRTVNNSGNWSEAIHLGSFQIDTVAPIISADRNAGPNINGWYNSDVTVTFDGIDELSGIDSITAPIIISSEGQGQFVVGSVTDLAGNSAQITEDNINIDKTAPVISASRDAGPNANGWNNADITVSFSGSDDLSGIDSITGPILVSSEGANQSIIGTITDLAGNSVSIAEDNINIDKTSPIISAGRDLNPNINGWHNSDVTVTFSGLDDLSGVDTLTGPVLLSLEGANQSAIGTVTDLAGNSTSITETGINIDKTSPIISAARDLSPNINGWHNSDITVSFSGSDDLSGVDTLTGPILLNLEGADQSALGTVIDLAGNSASIAETGINIDKTSPIISASRDIAPNINGFNNSDVTVSFNASDSLSGVLSVTAPIIVNSESADQSVTGIVTDLAGNSAQVTETGINIDKTAPVISITSPANGSITGVSQTLLFTLSDNLTSSPDITGPASGTIFNTAGTHNITITAADLAGNSSSESLSFTISSDVIESQLSNSSAVNFLISSPQTFSQFQFNSFDSIGSALFYHPLTPVDMSAIEEFSLDEGAYEFIDGAINIKDSDEDKKKSD